jgi:hypothetical protein
MISGASISMNVASVSCAIPNIMLDDTLSGSIPITDVLHVTKVGNVDDLENHYYNSQIHIMGIAFLVAERTVTWSDVSRGVPGPPWPASYGRFQVALWEFP